jgi:hypothetical protein
MAGALVDMVDAEAAERKGAGRRASQISWNSDLQRAGARAGSGSSGDGTPVGGRSGVTGLRAGEVSACKASEAG